MIKKTYYEFNAVMEAINAAEKLGLNYSLEKRKEAHDSLVWKDIKNIYDVYELTIHLEDLEEVKTNKKTEIA